MASHTQTMTQNMTTTRKIPYQHKSTFLGAFALGAAALLPLLVATAAHADERTTAVDAQLYRPAMDGNGVFSIERAEMLKKYSFTLRLSSNFALAPLSLNSKPDYTTAGMPPTETISDSGSAEKIIDSTTSLNLGFAFGITDNLTLALEMPFMVQSLGSGYGTQGAAVVQGATPRPGTGFFSNRPASNIGPSSEPVGDLRVGFKLHLFTGFAVQVIGWVPFGDEDVFAGSKSIVGEPKLIYDILRGSFKVTINVAARIREGQLVSTKTVASDGTLVNAMGVPAGLDPAASPDRPLLFVGSEAVAGIGLVYQATDAFSVLFDGHAFIPIAKAPSGTCTGDCKDGDLTGEVVAGVAYDLGNGVTLTGGVGAGVMQSAARSPTVRVLAGLTWAPSGTASRTVSSRGDRDGDGIVDSADLCPDEPEDMDGFQDDDGCPELDNDLDGVLDAQDKCPNEPEDRDGFQDDDGCPDPDNDGDGIPDLIDRCPNQKEDFDGWEDQDGCPDDDNDGDGFIDSKDQCPNEAETVNGYQDDDGCPDVAQQGGPKLGAAEIDLQGDRIEFAPRTATLTKKSMATLDLVAKVITANKALRFRIEAGVPESRKDKRAKVADVTMSENRAAAVKRYLLAKGVDVQQLDTAGLGSDRPIDRDPKSERNNRVQFIRLTQ